MEQSIKMINNKNMRKLYTIMAILVAGVVSTAQAQTRYLDEVFTNVDVQSNVTYGVNATVLYYSIAGEAVPEALKMDIYSPVGDTATSRPLMLFFHTGNFLPSAYVSPQVNNGGTGGQRTDSSAVEICTRFAKMGYVVASCDYRLGWNPIAPTQEERVNTLINAAYRGVQDCRTAVRYFRKSIAESGNVYGIDGSKIVAFGQGTGGYITLANAGLDIYEDVLLPKFFGSNGMPMVIEIVNGNLDGTTYGINPLTSDTLCYANHLGYSSAVSATVNLGGAIGDSSWFDETDGPVISFHTPTDPFAPYGDGMVVVPIQPTPLNVVEVSGSRTVQAMASLYGNNDVFQQVEDATVDPYPAVTAGANLHNEGFYGLYPLVRPATQPYDSAPWEWWAPTHPNGAVGLTTNPDMSETKAKAIIDTIQMYTAPRLMCALNLPGAPCTSVGVSEKESNSFTVYPNPNNGQFVVKHNKNIASIRVYNVMGQVVFQNTAVNAQQFAFNNELNRGLYFVEMISNGKKITQRVVVE
jgi:hypothetical protein